MLFLNFFFYVNKCIGSPDNFMFSTKKKKKSELLVIVVCGVFGYSYLTLKVKQKSFSSATCIGISWLYKKTLFSIQK